MPAHVHQVALKKILRMRRMQRLDLRVLRAVQVIGVVPLNRLIQKRKAQRRPATTTIMLAWLGLPLDGYTRSERPYLGITEITNQFRQLFRPPGERRKCSEVTGDYFAADQHAARKGCFARTHRIQIADGKNTSSG